MANACTATAANAVQLKPTNGVPQRQAARIPDQANQETCPQIPPTRTPAHYPHAYTLVQQWEDTGELKPEKMPQWRVSSGVKKEVGFKGAWGWALGGKWVAEGAWLKGWRRTCKPRPGNAHKLRFNACKLPASTSWTSLLHYSWLTWCRMGARAVAWLSRGNPKDVQGAVVTPDVGGPCSAIATSHLSNSALVLEWVAWCSRGAECICRCRFSWPLSLSLSQLTAAIAVSAAAAPPATKPAATMATATATARATSVARTTAIAKLSSQCVARDGLGIYFSLFFVAYFCHFKGEAVAW